MTGFEKHKITHLSASSINLWKNAPDVWVAKYLSGHKQPFGPAPRRGQCVEDAVHATLTGTPFDQAVREAQDSFDKTFLIGDDNTSKERELIEPMAEIAVSELKQYGIPEMGGKDQRKITLTADFGDWSIPLIGFLDMTFPEYGLVVDLKTTTRVPSVMSADHQLQRAIYHAAMGNQAIKFLYVSAKKSNWLEDGDPADILRRAKPIIARLERFLSLHTADDALQCVPHNPDTFYWRGDEAGRHEMFGT